MAKLKLYAKENEIPEPDKEKIIIDGDFIENSYVVVKIGKDKVKRKVYYSVEAGDLYIWYKGSKYFYCEFQYQ